jgi:hypothetical protein
VTLGDGARSLFWRSSWHGDKPLCTQFPRLFGRSRRKNKTVGATVNGNSWIHDLHRRFPPELLPEFLSLWHLLPDIMLRPETPDSIRWILTSNGCYSAASAYRLHFEGQVRSIAPAMIWSTWAPPKCRIFAWLLLQNRLWCTDRLQRRQCINSYFCPLCIRNLETSWHLFFECPFAKSIWATVATWTHCSALDPLVWEHTESMAATWQSMMERCHPPDRKGIASLFILVCWGIWNERNARIFRGKTSTLRSVISWIRDEVREWSFANAKALRRLMFEPP